MVAPFAGDEDELLTRAVHYALGSVAGLRAELLARPTPCSEWDLGTLLWHCCGSLAALEEGFASGRVRMIAGDADGQVRARANLARALGASAFAARALEVSAFAARAEALLHAASSAGAGRQDVTIGGHCLATADLAAAGALEIAVHGWDIAQASGSRRPIPRLLALRLLEVAPLLVNDADRAPSLAARSLATAPLFAAPVSVGCEASASDRLTGFLGRGRFMQA
jgi:uncharacterized protein (TIGR03086 family)